MSNQTQLSLETLTADSSAEEEPGGLAEEEGAEDGQDLPPHRHRLRHLPHPQDRPQRVRAVREEPQGEALPGFVLKA